jgi:hypothetical protein
MQHEQEPANNIPIWEQPTPTVNAADLLRLDDDAISVLQRGFHEFGAVVILGVFTPAQCEIYKTRLLQEILPIADVPSIRNGYVDFELMTSAEIRASDELHAVYGVICSAIWGNTFNRDAGVVIPPDRSYVQPTPPFRVSERPGELRGAWAHLDNVGADKIPDIQAHAVIAAVPGTGTVALPGTPQIYNEIIAATGAKGGHFKFSQEDQRKIGDLLGVPAEQPLPYRVIDAPPGSVVIWSSRTVHYAATAPRTPENDDMPAIRIFAAPIAREFGLRDGKTRVRGRPGSRVIERTMDFKAINRRMTRMREARKQCRLTNHAGTSYMQVGGRYGRCGDRPQHVIDLITNPDARAQAVRKADWPARVTARLDHMTRPVV